MKIAVVGVGAIGGWIAFKMAEAGHEVSAVARGATLAALRAHGIRMGQGDHARAQPITATDDAASLGPQDLVVIAVKGPARSPRAPAAAALMGPDTVLLPAMNGVPWWFFEGLSGRFEGRSLDAIDPGGRIDALLPPKQVIGCVVHAACVSPEPGLVVHRAGAGLIIGEPAGGPSQRVDRLAAALRDGGFDVEVSPRIQQAIWYKLWGNMTMNPISALCGATAD